MCLKMKWGKPTKTSRDAKLSPSQMQAKINQNNAYVKSNHQE